MTADRPGAMLDDEPHLVAAHGDRHQTLLDQVALCELGPVVGT